MTIERMLRNYVRKNGVWKSLSLYDAIHSMRGWTDPRIQAICEEMEKIVIQELERSEIEESIPADVSVEEPLQEEGA